MKLWIDDVRPAPYEHEDAIDWIWCKTVNVAKYIIEVQEREQDPIELLDLDHDGGDYIKLLDWLEETGRNYPIHIHSANPVGVQNMRAIIEKNGWKEVF